MTTGNQPKAGTAWGASRIARIALRSYAIAAFIAAAFLSQPVLAFIALFLLAFYIFVRLPKANKPRWSRVSTLTDLFVYFALVAFLQPRLGIYAVPVALPLLGGLGLSLESQAATLPLQPGSGRRQATTVALSLFTIVGLSTVSSLALFNGILAVAALVAAAGLAALSMLALRSLQRAPAVAGTVKLRAVAGSRHEQEIVLSSRSAFARRAAVSSPYDWLTVAPPEVNLRSAACKLTVTLAPPLSGPAEVAVEGLALDRFGLFMVPFTVKLIDLLVTPRARYASWMARKYLKGTGPGLLPMLSTSGALRHVAKSPTGIEYYGSRWYQPGDSLRDIDWKHSSKLRQLVTKEFTELRGRPALLLVNLTVSSAEEADQLAYTIISVTLFFARENIPAAFAAYDRGGVRLLTRTLDPVSTVTRGLALLDWIAVAEDPVRHLAPPDVTQLRANIFRLGRVETPAARGLSGLLRLEYESLQRGARQNPSTTALVEGMGKADRQSNLVVISMANHDAEALAFNTFAYQQRGFAVIMV